jgi:hypothetical protein
MLMRPLGSAFIGLDAPAARSFLPLVISVVAGLLADLTVMVDMT